MSLGLNLWVRRGKQKIFVREEIQRALPIPIMVCEVYICHLMEKLLEF